MMQAQSTPYGPVANVYDAFLTLMGFKRGVENFLDRVHFDLPANANVLDVACGTGLVSFYLARRFPSASILGTDIDERMLAEMERLAAEQGIRAPRIRTALADINTPDRVRYRDTNAEAVLPEASFDCITASGALEHADLDRALAGFKRLLKPGGTLFTLNVRRNPAGAVLAMAYHFRPYGIAELRNACAKAGLEDIRVLRLGAEDFPANLSRIAIVARNR
ncbi:class I SAM-dependent methyltransferase [Candidatus Parcubacteria bacterium]|nr:MAG: class I SAM-dependent methyltransferase [Candidatus Parcubacteria bacterium]